MVYNLSLKLASVKEERKIANIMLASNKDFWGSYRLEGLVCRLQTLSYWGV